MRICARVVVALGASAILSSSVLAQVAFDQYGQSWRPISLPPIGSGSFGVAGDFLPDARAVIVTGASVYLERTAGSATFDIVGTLDSSEVLTTDPSFLRVSPDGSSVAIGAGFGKPVVVFATSSLGAPGAPVTLTSGTLARYYDIGHFEAAWQDSTHLAVTAGDFGSPSFVSLLDTSSSTAAPINPVIVSGIGGASGGVAFDSAGRLYTGNGFDIDAAGSGTGAIRVFAPDSWSAAPVNFENDGLFIGEVLSANGLLFDAEGNLVVGGGDFSGDSGYLGVINAEALAAALAGAGAIDPEDPLQLLRLDPLGTGAGYFGAAFDPRTGELFATSGTTWYGTIPAPSAIAIALISLGTAVRRRRHA